MNITYGVILYTWNGVGDDFWSDQTKSARLIRVETHFRNSGIFVYSRTVFVSCIYKLIVINQIR